MNFKHPIYGNNGLREMTPEEIEYYSKPQPDIPEPEPSDKERIAALEAAMDENTLLLADIVGGVI